MAAFSGFPRKYFTFFNQLKKNNTKEWFEAHRSDYEEFVMHPAREFVMAMGQKLRKIAPGVNAIVIGYSLLKYVENDIFLLSRAGHCAGLNGTQAEWVAGWHY